MPRKKSEIDYKPLPGARYRVLVGKIGHEDDWGFKGQEYDAEEYPEVNFEAMKERNLVARVDAGANQPAPPVDEPGTVSLARPHQEFGSTSESEQQQHVLLGGQAKPAPPSTPAASGGTTGTTVQAAPAPPAPAPQATATPLTTPGPAAKG